MKILECDFKCPNCGVVFEHTFPTNPKPHEAKPLECPACGNIANLKEVNKRYKESNE